MLSFIRCLLFLGNRDGYKLLMIGLLSDAKVAGNFYKESSQETQ